MPSEDVVAKKYKSSAMLLQKLLYTGLQTQIKSVHKNCIHLFVPITLITFLMTLMLHAQQ